MVHWLNAIFLKDKLKIKAFLHVKTPHLKKKCHQIGQQLSAENMEMWAGTPMLELHYHIIRTIDIPQVAFWTSCAKIASRIQSLDKSLCMLIDGPVSLVYGLWPLETSKWTKPNITASFAQWSKDAGLRNETAVSKNRILSSKDLSDLQHFWQLPYSMHAKMSLMNADKATRMFLWH